MKEEGLCRGTGKREGEVHVRKKEDRERQRGEKQKIRKERGMEDRGREKEEGWEKEGGKEGERGRGVGEGGRKGGREEQAVEALTCTCCAISSIMTSPTLSLARLRISFVKSFISSSVTP